MRRSSFMLPATLLAAAFLTSGLAVAQEFSANHPGFWVEWIQSTQSTAADVALGDADQDGDLDLFVIDGGALQLWNNDGRGTFQPDPRSLAPHSTFRSIVVADVDGDRISDLVAAIGGGASGLAFLRGNGDGTYEPPLVSLTERRYEDLILADMSGDARPEMVGTADLGLDIIELNSNGTFSILNQLLPDRDIKTVAGADLNGDGRTDLVASTFLDQQPLGLEVLENQGGAFSRTALLNHLPFPVVIVPVDLDGDQDLDLVTGDDVSTIGLFYNDGTGRNWVDGPPAFDHGSIWTTVHAADVDGDGRSELFISYRHSVWGVYIAEYQCVDDPGLAHPLVMPYQHSEQRGLPPNKFLSGDLNGDARPDLVLLRTWGTTEPQNTPASLRGQIGVLLTRANGLIGAIVFRGTDVGGFRITPAKFSSSGSADLVFSQFGDLYRVDVQPDGAFAPSQRIGAGSFARAQDLDGNGRDDMIVRVEAHTEVRLTDEHGAVGEVKARIPGSVLAIGDLNRDQRPDLVLQDPSGVIAIAWNDPQCRFHRVVRTPLLRASFLQGAVLVGDADGDGHDDLVQVQTHGTSTRDPAARDTVSVYRVSVSGHVRLLMATALPSPPYPFELNIYDAKMANLDQGPGEEIVMAVGAAGAELSRLRVLRSLGTGQFQEGAESVLGGESPGPLVLDDLDGNGNVDAACITNIIGFVSVLHVRWNDGAGNLTGEWKRRLASSRAVDLAAGDFDADGTPDLAVLAPYHDQPYEGPSQVAFVFGRRDASSATVSAADYSMAHVAPVSLLTIDGVTPNPARNMVAIRWSGLVDQPAQVELHDVAGRRVRNLEIAAGPQERAVRLDALGDLPAGLYWIRLRQGELTATKRVVLVR